MANDKKVNKEEFNNVIKNYPKDLEVDVCYISMPPLVSYNDFSTGLVWPESIIAYIRDFSRMGGILPRYSEKDNEYYLSRYYVERTK